MTFEYGVAFWNTPFLGFTLDKKVLPRIFFGKGKFEPCFLGLQKMKNSNGKRKKSEPKRKAARARKAPAGTPTRRSRVAKASAASTLPVLRSLTCMQVAAVFGVDDATIQDWVNRGCPTVGMSSGPGRPGHLLDLYQVMQWRKEAEYMQSPAKQRTEEERWRKLKIENDESEGKLVARAEMEDVLASRLVSFRNFWERSLAMTRPDRANRSVEELVAIDYELGKQIMDSYLGVRETGTREAEAQGTTNQESEPGNR